MYQTVLFFGAIGIVAYTVYRLAKREVTNDLALLQYLAESPVEEFPKTPYWKNRIADYYKNHPEEAPRS